MNRVLSIQDMSCFGKCSLTIALPVISAMGVECVPVPTCVLSTHTGGLGKVHLTELTESVEPITDHLLLLGVNFDVIYIGYLGSISLIRAVTRLINNFKSQDPIILLDPVMGDNGSLYKRFDTEYVKEMRTLAAFADFVVPNLTELSFLTGTEYEGESVSEEYLSGLFDIIDKGFSSRFIITGICPDEASIQIISPKKGGNPPIFYTVKRRAARFHGTGDLFASIVAGGLAKGLPLNTSIRKAADFTASVIENTTAAGFDERFGLQFESCLNMLFES